jgi:hypothetical protein
LGGTPAERKEMATACFCGRPDFINSRMLALTTLLDLPFLSGII